jgi:hypothetical protein
MVIRKLSQQHIQATIFAKTSTLSISESETQSKQEIIEYLHQTRVWLLSNIHQL